MTERMPSNTERILDPLRANSQPSPAAPSELTQHNQSVTEDTVMQLADVRLARNVDAVIALREYMELRDKIAQLEAMVNEDCQCDSSNFHRCDLCEDLFGAESRSRSLMDLWGDNWAVMLHESVNA